MELNLKISIWLRKKDLDSFNTVLPSISKQTYEEWIVAFSSVGKTTF